MLQGAGGEQTIATAHLNLWGINAAGLHPLVHKRLQFPETAKHSDPSIISRLTGKKRGKEEITVPLAPNDKLPLDGSKTTD